MLVRMRDEPVVKQNTWGLRNVWGLTYLACWGKISDVVLWLLHPLAKYVMKLMIPLYYFWIFIKIDIKICKSTNIYSHQYVNETLQNTWGGNNLCACTMAQTSCIWSVPCFAWQRVPVYFAVSYNIYLSINLSTATNTTSILKLGLFLVRKKVYLLEFEIK